MKNINIKSNVKINGKEFTKEEVSNFINKINLKLQDTNKNSTPDIVDELNKKGVSGKIIGTILNSYLNQKNVDGEGVVTVLQNKIKKIEAEVKNNATPNLNLKEKDQIDTAKYIKKLGNSYSDSNIRINIPSINTNPFLQIIVYALIAAFITTIIVTFL